MGVSSAVLSKNMANAVVVLGVVLGSRDVEIPATHSLIIHGPRAYRPAKILLPRFQLNHHYE